jgi:hypothetical protein
MTSIFEALTVYAQICGNHAPHTCVNTIMINNTGGDMATTVEKWVEEQTALTKPDKVYILGTGYKR